METVWLLILVPCSLYWPSTYFEPVEGTRKRGSLVLGILGLTYAALHLHTTYLVFFANLPFPTILFRISHGIVGGALATILISMGFRHGTRAMLVLSGVLLVALPVLAAFDLHRLGHEVSLRIVIASPTVLCLDSYPIGIAIPAVILLLRPSWIRSQSIGDSAGLTDAGSAAKSGTEA